MSRTFFFSKPGKGLSARAISLIMFKYSRAAILMALLIISMALSSCSGAMQAVRKENLNVLILGNSVTHHTPDPAVGWHGDWGMAATAPDKDFKSVYATILASSGLYGHVDVKSYNIALWENDFTYNIDAFQIEDKAYDVVILRLGENVNTIHGYRQALIALVSRFAHTGSRVIITGLIWENAEKELVQQNLAISQGYLFLPMDDFRSNPANYATGQFENGAVAAHPSDAGMRRIAEMLYAATVAPHN